MNRRRERRRASDIAQVNPRRGLSSLILFGIALAVILVYQFSVSEDAADIIGDIVGDPEMTIPTTVLDQVQSVQGGVAAPKDPTPGVVEHPRDPRPVGGEDETTPAATAPSAPAVPATPVPGAAP